MEGSHTCPPFWRGGLPPKADKSAYLNHGGMAERFKAHAWKACISERVSWVQIPVPPPKQE